MLLLKPTCPVDYRLCNQTVTVYHKECDSITRTVYENAFLDYKKTQTVDKTGSKEANSFLLVIPGSSQAVFIDDKVYEGVGPEISTVEQWRDFIPSKVRGVVVVKYADCKKWDNAIVHSEAGG